MKFKVLSKTRVETNVVNVLATTAGVSGNSFWTFQLGEDVFERLSITASERDVSIGTVIEELVDQHLSGFEIK